MLVADLIHLNARTRPHDVGLVVGAAEHTYSALSEQVLEVAAALTAAGVGRGDRVAVLGKNSLEYFLLYFACADRGALLVPLNFWHRAAEHAHTLADSEPSLAFVDPAYVEVLDDALTQAGSRAPVVGLPGFAGAERSGWEAFVRGAAVIGALDPVPLGPEDAHMLLYTSGTTGRAKGAVLSHGRTVDDAFSMALALGTRPDDVYLNYFPPFHVGNWDHMKLFLLPGAKVVLLPEFDAGEVLAHVERHGATVVLGVPTMLHALLEHPSLATTDVSSIRLVYYGAYDPSGIMQRTAEAFGAHEGRIEMAHTYGLTEGGCFVTVCPPADVFAHWGSIGRAVPGVEVALLDDELREVPLGEPGEICVRGARMSGYWRRPEETAAALEGGWLHTGDVAVSDPDGFLTIVDRKKDMIRSGGQNVYSKEVEDCLAEHPAVVEAAVIGLPDVVYEERVCAVVVLREPAQDAEILRAELQAHVRGRLAGYNTPRTVQFVEAMPKTAVGKIRKNVLRERFGSMFDAPAQGGGAAAGRA